MKALLKNYLVMLSDKSYIKQIGPNGYNFYKLNNYSNSSTSFNSVSSSITVIYWSNFNYDSTTDLGQRITGQLSANGITMYDDSNNILPSHYTFELYA